MMRGLPAADFHPRREPLCCEIPMPTSRAGSLLRSFRFYAAVISGLAAIALLAAYSSREFTRVLDGLPWRSAQQTTGTVRSVVTIPAAGSTRTAFGKPGQNDRLLVGYQYTAGGREFTSQMRLPAAQFAGNDNGQPPATFPVFYQPADPVNHVAFDDPRERFWPAAVRLGVAAAVALGVLAAAVILLPKYGKADRVAKVTSEKLSWPGSS
jgi:hypothetical protein